MDVFYLCLGLLFITALGFIALVVYALTRPKSTQTVATSDRAYLAHNQRVAVLNIIAQVRVAPDMPEALDKASRYVETALWLPTSGALPETPPELLPGTVLPPTAVPSTPQPATSFYQEPPQPGTPAVVPATTPVLEVPTTPAAIPTPPPVPITAPIQAIARWIAPDNITILLYVGAAMFVIAAGVFVGSSWDEIGGFARFMIVAASALAFLGVGEAFVRFTDKLEPAGNTFRSVGTVLLPFTALAFDRFVLFSNGSPLYWVVVGLLLMLLNYGLYRVSQRGRLTGLLAALSYGIFAMSLPAALELDKAWSASTVWLGAGALFFIAARITPDGQTLVRQFFRKANHPLAESHFLMGWLLLATGFFLGFPYDVPLATAVAFALLTVILIGLTLYLDFVLLLGVAGVTVGIAAASLVNSVDSLLLNGEAIALAIIGIVLAGIAPLAQKRVKYATGVLTSIGLAWTIFARVIIDTDQLFGHSLTLVAYLIVTLLVAYRFRNVLTWLLGWLVLNVAVFDVLSLFPSDSTSVLIPAVLLLGLAVLWLVMEARPPYPDARGFARVSFVGQAGWMSFLFFILAINPSPDVTDVPLSALICCIGLTAGWVWLMVRTKAPLGVAPAMLQGASALVALAMALNLPTTSISGLWLVGGVVAVLYSWVAPTPFRRALNIGGLLLAVVAIFGSVVGDAVNLLSPVGVPTLLQTAQLVLAGAVLFYVWETVRQRQQVLVYATLALVYCLVAWLTLDYLPDPSVPLVALALGVVTLLVAPVAPGQSAKVLELIGYGVVFLAPYAGIVSGRYDTDEPLLSLNSHIWAQITLVLGAVVYMVRGVMRRQRAAIAIAGTMVYICYAWVALDRDIDTIQAYSVPFAALLLGYGWLFPTQRRVWEVASVFALLSVAGLQALENQAFLYSLVLGGWGLLLLILGITLNRRVLLVGGIVGLIFAALRQLWAVVALLHPAAIIALVGLALMVVAVVLTLTRERWIKRLQG